MIEITADTRRAVVTNKELLTKGSAGIQVQFTLSEDWDGLSKMAVFRLGDDGEKVDCVLDSGLTCVVPPEVLTTDDEVVFCGIYGSNGQGTIIIPTIWASLGVVRPGTEPNTPATAEPTPEIWAQILGVAQDAEQTANEAYTMAENAQGYIVEETVRNAVNTFVNTTVPAAEQAIADVQADAEQAVEDKGEEVLDSIPQDYTDLVDDVADLSRQISDVEENQISELKSAIVSNTEVIDNNLSQLYGKNIFNPLWLASDGIINTGGESYGKNSAFAAIGKIPFTIPSGTQYTVSFEAYMEPISGSTIDGFTMQFFRADGTTVSAQIVVPTNTDNWTEFHVTPNLYFGANGFQFTFSSNANDVVHLRKIQIEYGNAVTAYENSLTAYDKKAGDMIESVTADLGAIENDLSEFKNLVITEYHSDILYGHTPVFGKFCDPSTGEIKNIGFYAVLNLPIPDDVQILYPYNANDATNHALRAVCFYSSDTQDTSTFISGQSGTASSVAYGILVPNNAISCAVTIGNESIAEEYYLSSVRGGDVVTKYLAHDIHVTQEQIDNFALKQNIPVQLQNRKPTFAFIFDDGTDGDINTKALFDSYGFKCGFALLGESTYLTSRRVRYLEYQDDGFEILSHSVNGTAFSSVTDLVTAESYLKNSLTVLTENGFNVQGWVTPSTWLLADQMPLVEKYYQYGYGHLTGTPEGTAYHQFIGLDIRQLDRWGLEEHTVEQTMAKIDEAIAAGAYMIFYGHSYPSTENNMTTENMNTILTYLKTKSDNGEVMVDTPRNTINNYYSFRHSDLLKLISDNSLV